MSECKKFKKDFVAFLSQELDEEKRKLLQSHLDRCPECKHEMAQLEKFMKGAESLKVDIEQAMEAVDWEELPMKITKNVFKQGVSALKEPWLERLSRFLFQPRLRPVYASLLLGVLLGSLATFLILRAPQLKEARAMKISVPSNFLERMELEMARRETLDYLEKSQYLLLDFVQSPSDKSAEFWQSEFASQKARELLDKKKYINPQLDKYQMVKAKMICDQIELLFYELSQISVKLSSEEIEKIQNLIKEKQIFLKIDLLKKELGKSEV
jgi:hypothetical protein